MTSIHVSTAPIAAGPERKTWEVKIREFGPEQARRVTAYSYSVEHGCVMFYDHGCILALAPGEWLSVELVTDDEG